MNNKEVEEQEKKHLESLQKYAKEKGFEIPERGDFKTKAIGYLSIDEEFEKGEVSTSFLTKLKILWNEGSILGCLGFHECEFCKGKEKATSCQEKILIDVENKIKYKFPEMIFHYIKCHQFLPPNKFIEFVMKK